MDTSFDLVALLKQQPTSPTTKKSHKIRPTQFVSVAGGVQKRLETNIKNRKSSRLSVFDRIRNITKCDSPKAPAISDAQQKALYRKQQLEKWKEEKDKKKKEAAAQKKKPFVAGMSQRQTFGPPPPPPKPSSSGRVTRSQARQKPEPKPSSTHTKSFAPSNATFKPSLFLNTEIPKLVPLNKKKLGKQKTNITFEPVLPKNLQKETKTTRTTRAKPVASKPVIEKKKGGLQPPPSQKTKAKIPQKPPPLKQQMFQSSSSSSDIEQPSKQRTKPNLRKSLTKIPDKRVPVVQLQSISLQNAQDVPMSQGTASAEDTALMSQDTASTEDTASMSDDITSISSHDEVSTPRNKIPRSESSSEEKLRSPKAIDIALTPEQIEQVAKKISPNVTVSRGKDNARKEMKKKLVEGLLDEDNSDMDKVNHFRQQLNSEITRLTAMCETWDQIFAQTVLPEPIQELVLTAVGQARLLMSQKLQQFAGLVESCARPTPGASLVTPADLHGFWDMVFMQVENVDMRFKSLEELRLRNWIEEEKPVVRKVAKPAAKKAAVKPAGGPSRLRQMIAAARKAQKVQESQSENSESEKSEAAPSPETKTFEAGFFKISSPLKQGSLAPATPISKPSLLKSVLSSEAKKSVSRNSASFAMLRASVMGKNVDIEGGSPLLQTPTVAVYLFTTPVRSILKQNNPVSAKKSERMKTVLFQDEPSSPTSYTSCDQNEPGITPLPADDKENTDMSTTSSSQSRLLRQDAVDQPSPAMTRSRRKSAQTQQETDNVEKKRSTRKSVHTPLVEADDNVQKKRSTRKSVQTPSVEADNEKRSVRKSVQTPLTEADDNVQTRRSTRKSVQTPLVEADNVEKKRNTRKGKEMQEMETPKRSTRRRKSALPV